MLHGSWRGNNTPIHTRVPSFIMDGRFRVEHTLSLLSRGTHPKEILRTQNPLNLGNPSYIHVKEKERRRIKVRWFWKDKRL
jgi:hypothetical protein